MPAEDVMARMRALVKRLKETSYAYYVLDQPIISDMQWDQMYDELKKLEAETGVILPDSSRISSTENKNIQSSPKS